MVLFSPWAIAMEAIVEDWSTGLPSDRSDYSNIVRTAFGTSGLGLCVKRALVAGARHAPDEDGHNHFDYRILWMIDAECSSLSGVDRKGLLKARQSGLQGPRLHKMEFVCGVSDVKFMENLFLQWYMWIPYVEFVEEIFFSKGSMSESGRRLHFERSSQ